MSDIHKALDAYRKASTPSAAEGKRKPKERENNSFVKETKNNQMNLKIKPQPIEQPQNKGNTAGGLEKTAKLLLLLGKEEAAAVLKHFKPDEVAKITSHLIQIKSIDKNEATTLFKELKRKTVIDDTFSGGVETVRKILYKAFGEEEGEVFLKKALPAKREKPFEFLLDIEPVQIKTAMKGEPLTMLSLLMNYLPPEKSAALLTEYSIDEQKEILVKMASGTKIRREIFERMENVIREKIHVQGKLVTREIDGKNSLANILKFMDQKSEEIILKELSEFDAELSQEIKDKTYTMDIVLSIPDMYFQKILNDFDDKEIAIVLKGQSAEVKKKILSSITQTRQELVRQESEYLGIMRKSEVNIKAREFIDYLKQAEGDGKIVIDRNGQLIY